MENITIFVDKYFGTWLLIKHLLNFFRYIGSKLKYICFISIDLAMYDMQITSYDANLSFFMDEFIIYVIIQHTKLLSMLDIFQQFTFVIKQKEQHTNLNINNNTNRCDRQK